MQVIPPGEHNQEIYRQGNLHFTITDLNLTACFNVCCLLELCLSLIVRKCIESLVEGRQGLFQIRLSVCFNLRVVVDGLSYIVAK